MTIKSTMYDLKEAELYADRKDGVISEAEFKERLADLKAEYEYRERKDK